MPPREAPADPYRVRVRGERGMSASSPANGGHRATSTGGPGAPRRVSLATERAGPAAPIPYGLPPGPSSGAGEPRWRDRAPPSAELLLPLGAEAFVRGSIDRAAPVLVGVGSGIVVEMERPKVVELLSERLLRIDHAVKDLESQMTDGRRADPDSVATPGFDRPLEARQAPMWAAIKSRLRRKAKPEEVGSALSPDSSSPSSEARGPSAAPAPATPPPGSRRPAPPPRARAGRRSRTASSGAA